MEHFPPIDAEGPLLGSIATLVGLASVAVFRLRHGRGDATSDERQSDIKVTMVTPQRDADAREKPE